MRAVTAAARPYGGDGARAKERIRKENGLPVGGSGYGGVAATPPESAGGKPVRRRIPRQSDMFAPLVDHELSRELSEIDAVLCAHPEWERWVHADLVRGVDASAGR